MSLKFIASGAGFFGLGALVGWAITADKAERKLKNNVQEFEIMTQQLRKKTHRITELEVELDELKDQESGLLAVGGEIEDVAFEEIPEETIEETRGSLQKLIDQYTSNQDDVDLFTERAGAVMDGFEDTPPFVIGRDKYAWDEEEGDEYSKITLTYFPNHRILLDDDQDPIDDVETMVGWRSLNQFGGESGDPDVVFVRNRRLETDFEIVRETDAEIPLHVKYGMPRSEFETTKAAGLLRLRAEDV